MGGAIPPIQILRFVHTASPVRLQYELLLAFIGTDAETHDFVKECLTWIGLGAAFSVFSGVIWSEGASGDAMTGSISGSVTNTIQAMGKALAAFILNLLRQGIFLIPLIFLLDHFFGLRGVVYSNPVADYLAVVVSYIVCIRYMKQMAEPDPAEGHSAA